MTLLSLAAFGALLCGIGVGSVNVSTEDI